MKFSLEVGSIEKHQLDFSFDQALGNVEIKVDGQRVIEDFRMLSLGLVKTYDFDIVGAEPLKVRIEKRRALLLAGFRPQKYKVFVNGELVGAYEGM